MVTYMYSNELDFILLDFSFVPFWFHFVLIWFCFGRFRFGIFRSTTCHNSNSPKVHIKTWLRQINSQFSLWIWAFLPATGADFLWEEKQKSANVAGRNAWILKGKLVINLIQTCFDVNLYQFCNNAMSFESFIGVVSEGVKRPRLDFQAHM